MIRKLISQLTDHLTKKPFTILTGARQLGKTTLLQQLHVNLIKAGEFSYYLTFEEHTILNKINEHPENIFQFARRPEETGGKRLFLLIDEVQYARDPSNFLKLLYDKYAPSLKIVATGSSAFYIDQHFKDSLAGRKQIFLLRPLDFEEFLLFKKETALQKELEIIKKRKEYISAYKEKLDALLAEYIIFGGYPAVVLAQEREEKITLLKELRSSFLKKDILESEVENEEKFYQLMSILASQIGGQVNIHELSTTLRMAEKTVDRYLFIMQKCFHIHLIKPFHKNIRKEITKMPKIYFNDTGLRNAILNRFELLSSRDDKGSLLENITYAFLLTKYEEEQVLFWRTADGNEVDFVIKENDLKGYALEVKWDDKQYNLSKYNKFISNYPEFPLTPASFEFGNSENWILKRS